MIEICAEAALLIWFFGCICTYRIGKYTLVDGMGIKSAEFVMLCLYVAGILFSLVLPTVGKWCLLGVLLFWAVVQFFCHWYFTIFGVSEEKLKGYNECFRNTVHIVPASSVRLVPDMYHIVLHILILINIILTIRAIV